jgi:hypothetical protein
VLVPGAPEPKGGNGSHRVDLDAPEGPVRELAAALREALDASLGSDRTGLEVSARWVARERLVEEALASPSSDLLIVLLDRELAAHLGGDAGARLTHRYEVLVR